MALRHGMSFFVILVCVWYAEAFNCTAAGRYAASTCNQYYLCVLTSTSNYTAYLYTCPGSSNFNSATGLCTTSSVTCSSSSTSTTTTATTAATTEGYTCTAAGRYAASNCNQYYLCVLTSTSNYTAYLYTCPGSSNFNSATGLCTTSSVTCSSSSTSTTSNTCTAFTTSTTSTTSTTPATTSTTPTTTTPATTSTTPTTTTPATTTAACNSNGFTCASSSTFYTCVDGTPLGDADRCPTGLYCSNSCSLQCSTTESC